MGTSAIERDAVPTGEVGSVYSRRLLLALRPDARARAAYELVSGVSGLVLARSAPGAKAHAHSGSRPARFGVCGDRTHGARIEDAFTSGKLLARAMLGEQRLPASHV